MPDTTNDDVQLRFKGDKRYLPRQGSQFFPELTALCRRAGLLGTVSVGVLNNYTDLRTQEGMHVNTPRKNGVPVSWHNSDKEAVQVLIPGYNGMDIHTLYEHLLKACGETQEMPMPKSLETDAVLSKILGEEPSSQEAEPQGTLAAEAGPEEAAAPAAKPEVNPMLPWTRTPSCTTKFFDNTDNTGLFLLEMAARANQQGELSTSECVAILRREFGFLTVKYSDSKRRVEYNEPYGVLTRLGTQEFLAKGPKFYRLTQKARELLGEKVEPQPEERPEEAAPETPIQLVSTMLEKLTALAQRVEAAKAKRTRLCELDARQVEIIAQQRALEIELAQVVAEMQPLVTDLQDRRVKDDEAAYAAVEMLFKE